MDVGAGVGVSVGVGVPMTLLFKPLSRDTAPAGSFNADFTVPSASKSWNNVSLPGRVFGSGNESESAWARELRGRKSRATEKSVEQVIKEKRMVVFDLLSRRYVV